ncbi:sad [Symbiodinium natans]|uniref:Sad protein n=1 Tax=Symbiodinium natans TaxID=878477 RepID=A0A812PBI9_9DINO|nr:sad [Symbiodinium natans]
MFDINGGMFGWLKGKGEQFVQDIFHETLDPVCQVDMSPSEAWEKAVVLDIGSNTGFYGLLALAKGCAVVFVEPQPECNVLISQSIRESGLDERKVRRVQQPVGRQEEWGKSLAVWPGNHCSGRFPVENAERGHKDAFGSDGASQDTQMATQIPFLPVSDMLELVGLSDSSKIQLIKVDTEGNELQILEAMLPLLQSWQISNMVVEVTPMWWHHTGYSRNEGAEIFEGIAALGFAGSTIRGHSVQDATAMRDYILHGHIYQEMLLRALNFCSADQIKVTLESAGTVLAEAMVPMRAALPDVLLACAGSDSQVDEAQLLSSKVWPPRHRAVLRPTGLEDFSAPGVVGVPSQLPYVEFELLQLVDGSLPASLGSKPLLLALENKQEQLVRGYLSFDYVERLSLQEQALCVTAAIQQSPFMLLQLLDQIQPSHEHLLLAIRLGQDHLIEPILQAGGLSLMRSPGAQLGPDWGAGPAMASTFDMAMFQRLPNLSGLHRFAWTGSRSLKTFPQINPQTSETFKVYEEMTGAEVQQILASATTAQQAWRRRPASERVAAFAPLGEALRSRAEEVADLVCQEMGKPVAQGKAEVLKCAYLATWQVVDHVDWYVENGAKFLEDTEYPALPGFKKSFVTYQPLGTVLSVMPWNFPIWQVIRMGIPTLMAGNAVLLKHAPNCFGSGLVCEELLAKLDIPDGLFRSLLIDVPQVSTVLEHPSVQGVALTGSEGAGRAVAAKAGGLLKKAVIELGGSDAYAVLADADLDLAAEAVVNARVANSGQTCIAPKRAIVDKRVKAAFEQKVLEKVALKKYGVDFGPLVHPKGRDDVAAQVAETQAQGARLLCGGASEPPSGDCKSFYPPTVLTDVKPGMTAFETEIFGPVIAIIEAPAEDEEDVLRLSNQTSYGLAGAVCSV